MHIADLFARFSHVVARLSGRPATFCLALLGILVWAISGPIFGFSETWQLVVNTATTIVTFLMVFVLQNSQNRDGEAVQAKLDELILVTRAKNSFIGAEKLSDEELRHLRAMIVEEAARSGATLETKRHRAKNGAVVEKTVVEKTVVHGAATAATEEDAAPKGRRRNRVNG